MKEYRGEKITDRLTARLVPPSAQYSDSMCELILTGRHLYVLEDNFDGTYETRFTFFIERIRALETQIKGSKYDKSVLGELFLSGILALMGGILYTPGKRKEDDGIRFVITYDDSMGNCNKLYFKDLQSNSNRFIKTYYKQKKALNH